jgi:hypothetical protein
VLASLGVATALLAGGLPGEAQDVLAVGSVEAAAGATVAVPVTIRDLAGTPLDEGDGADLEIQGFAFRLDFAPAAAVAAVDFQQAGVTAGHEAVFPIIQPAADHIVVLLSFDEATDPLAFTLDAPAPGDVVGELVFELSPVVPPGTVVALSFEAATATLVNDSATLSEAVGAGTLAVVGGSLATPLFADGFESGDFSAWSAVVP